MYARSPDEPLPQSGSTPSPFSVQLYPYHQQAFRQQHYAGPATPYDSAEPQWPQPPPPPPPRLNHPQQRTRPHIPQYQRLCPQFTTTVSRPCMHHHSLFIRATVQCSLVLLVIAKGITRSLLISLLRPLSALDIVSQLFHRPQRTFTPKSRIPTVQVL